MSSDRLIMWTIYDRPTDYPDCYVGREWAVAAGGVTRATGNVVTSNSLAYLRAMMVKTGLTCICREPGDDPKIVESWL